jgi:hypothetical protein
MKHPYARPSLVCRLVRWRCALAGASRSRHVARCPDCQAHFSAAEAFTRQLRADAIASSRSMPGPAGGFESRLVRAVRNAPRHEQSGRGASAGWTLGVAMAAAATAWVVFVPTQTPPSAPGTATLATPDDVAAATVAIVETVSSGLADSVIPSAGQLVAANPLQQEIASAYDDLRSAVDFLVMNFSPTTPAAPDPIRRI